MVVVITLLPIELNGINGCIYNTGTGLHNLLQNNVLFIFVFHWCLMQMPFIAHRMISRNLLHVYLLQGSHKFCTHCKAI